MKIFLVEDDELLNDIIVTTLEGINYEVSSFNDGKKALDNIHAGYDLYLLDINLPHVNGLELLKKIKSVNSEANIFILSADIDIKTVLSAYNTGCNDFIKKPFDIREVVAKIKNSLKEEPVEVPLVHNGMYYKNEKIITFGSKTVKLTKKEVLLMDILIKYRGKNVNNAQIEAYVWGENNLGGYVRQLVSKIRSKLPYKDVIENHTSSGYKIHLHKSFLIE